ncbi:MAG: OsmC family protein [Saprospiraceae bacterium]|nr:OsmC family protein [Saprospiraceae bacterium]
MAEVNIKIERGSGSFHLISENELGHRVETDGSPDIGGENKGARPTELVIMGLGTCSAIDVILILEKQRQRLDDIKIEINAQKEKIDTYSEFKKIHMHFHLWGKIKSTKAQQAIDLSIDKYCTVAHLLKKTASITTEFTIYQKD